LLYLTIFQFTLITLSINKYRLLINYTFRNWSSIVDSYAPIFGWRLVYLIGEKFLVD